jgi:hypothetical protein
MIVNSYPDIKSPNQFLLSLIKKKFIIGHDTTTVRIL